MEQLARVFRNGPPPHLGCEKCAILTADTQSRDPIIIMNLEKCTIKKKSVQRFSPRLLC